MLIKKELNTDYKYTTDFLKEILIQLSENDNMKYQIKDEVQSKVSEINKEINSILKKSFFNYCTKKGEQPYLLLSAYEKHHNRSLSRESNQDDYDFIKFTVHTWERSALEESNYNGCTECKKIGTWNSTKQKYMENLIFQRYKGLEGSFELMNGLLGYLQEIKFNK